jgi:hypothetical protein
LLLENQKVDGRMVGRGGKGEKWEEGYNKT